MSCRNRFQNDNLLLTYSKVGETGLAVGIDHIEELVQMSVNNVKNDRVASSLLDSGRLQLVTGDGRKGYQPSAPYDAIHVGAAAAEIPQAVSEKELRLPRVAIRL